MSHAQRKLDNLEQAKRLLLLHPEGVTDAELADALKVDYATAFRYRVELGAVKVSKGHWTYQPTPADIELADLILSRVTQH